MALLVPPTVPTTLEEVIARMEAIDASLPATDGVACFNRVYLDVTRQVAGGVTQGYFADPPFVTRLDVVFASIYLDAVDANSTSPGNLPKAWEPLLAARGDTDIEPIQFALAGMNAHINHDLPIAVVSTCAALRTSPDHGSHHDDYQKVDDLLAAAEQKLRQSFEFGVVLEADRHLQAVANVVANWSITTARAVAWDTAVALWAMRDIDFARNLMLGSLARTVGMASRGLLVAV